MEKLRGSIDILNVAQALKFQASMPIEFLGHFVLGTSHLINMTPCETHIFGYSLMHIIKSVIEKDLLVVVENVFLLVFLM